MSTTDLHRSERHAALAAQDFADTHPTRQPFLFGSPMDRHRTGFAACHGPCDQGDRKCKTPDACRLPDDDWRSLTLTESAGVWGWLLVACIVVAALIGFGWLVAEAAR